MQRCHIVQWHDGLEHFWKAKDDVQDNFRTELSHVENNTVQLLASLLDAYHWWTAHGHLVLQNSIFFNIVQGLTPLLLSWTSCAAANGRFWNIHVLIRYESLRLRSLRQSERTTARDPVQRRCEFIPALRRSMQNINKDGRADGVRRLPKHLAEGDK